MSSCVIKRGEDRKVVSVTTRSGQRSELFDHIASIPVMENRNRAVSIFKNVYSNRFIRLFGNWLKRTPKNAEALKAIKKNIEYVPEGLRDFVIEKASEMDNPMMLGVVNPGEGISLDGQSYYSTDLSKGEVVLVDAMSVSDMDMSVMPVPDTMSREDYINGYVRMSSSPVVNLTTPDGRKFVIIKNSVKTFTPVELQTDSRRNTGMVYADGEPRMFFLASDGRIFESYGEALKHETGPKLRAGFVSGTVEDTRDGSGVADVSLTSGGYTLNNPKSFIPVMTLDTTTNISSRQGLINYLIKKGYLSGSKIYDPETNKYYLTGAGYTGGMRLFNSASSYAELTRRLPFSDVSMDERGYIDIKIRDRSRVEVIDADGKKKKLDKKYIKEELKLGRYNELDSKYQHFDALVLSLILSDNSIYKDYTNSIVSSLSNEEMRQKIAITNILQSLGVRVVGMSDYLEKYKTRYGYEPSARALADMANNVIAVSENATANDILEETAHFLVEAYKDQDAVRSILGDVESTEEWNTYASQYYDVYGRTLKGEELEDAVHREILGKILRNRFAETFRGPQVREEGFLGSVKALLRNMINSIKSNLTSQKSDLNKVVEDIRNRALSGDFSTFDMGLLDSNSYTLYSITSNRNRFIKNKIADLRKTAFKLRQISTDRGVTATMSLDALADIEKKLGNVDKQITDNEVVLSLDSLINSAEAQVNYLKKLVEKASAEGNEELISPADRQNVKVISDQVIPMLTDIRGFINNHLELKSIFESYIAKGGGIFAQGSGEAVKRDFINRIDKAVSDLNSVKSDMDSHIESDAEKLVERLSTRWHIPKEHVNKIKDLFNGVQKDVSTIARWFGILEHSSNIINGALGMLIAENNYKAMVKTQEDLHDFLKDVKRGNWDVSRFENLIQKVDGKYSNYLSSAINMAAFDRDFRLAQMRVFAQVIPELKQLVKDGKLTDEKITEIVNSGKYFSFKKEVGVDDKGKPIEKTIKLKPGITRTNLDILTAEQEKEYSEKMREWILENTEQPYTESYESRMQKMYDDIKRKTGRVISESTKEYLKNLSRQKYILKRPFYNEDGTFRYAEFAQSSNYVDFCELQKRKKEATSIYTYVGGQKIRKGIDTPERDLAEDLQAINEEWRGMFEDKTDRELTAGFMDTLNQLQKEKDGSYKAWLYITHGGHVSFSEEFWKDMGYDFLDKTKSENVASYEAMVKALDDEAPDKINDHHNLLTGINEARETIREIISNNRDSSNPGDVAFDSMTESEKETVREMSEIIEQNSSALISEARELKMDIDKYLRRSTDYENDVNEVYYNEQRDSGLEDYEFAKRHMTRSKADRVDMFRRKLTGVKNRQLFKGQEIEFFKKKFGFKYENPKTDAKNFREQVNAEIERMTSSERTALVNEYSHRFVLSYFKRMTPVGYKEFVQRIKDGKIDIPQMVKDMRSGRSTQDYGINLKYLNFEPNRQWLEEDAMEESTKNPNYRPNHGYGYYLPKKEKYTDNGYLARYGIKTVNGKETATSNVEEWKMLQKLKELSEKSQDSYRMRSKNVYLLPQISKQSIERFARTASHPTDVAQNYVKDLMADRVDDSLYGRTDDAQSIDVMDRNKALPRYYINELEDRTDVSHDLAYSYSMLVSQANLYNEKTETLRDAIGLEQILISSQFNNGKKPEATQAYQMFQDFLNDYFYGIRINHKKLTMNILGFDVDVTKLMIMMDRLFATMNLALSPFVAATGMVTGQANFLIEGAVGQYIDKDSIGYAYKELARNMPSYINDIGDIDRKSKLYVLGERLGVFNFQSKIYGAGYNRVVRTITRDPLFKMMEVSNAPLNPQIMIASLDGVRYYEGRFFTKRELQAYLEAAERDTGDIDSLWKSLRQNSLWNNIDVRDGKVVALRDSQIDSEAILSELGARRNRIRSLMQICNGSLNEENRISATRNWLGRFLVAHRGWLFIAAQRLWKAKGYNFQTMQEEEGLLRSINSLRKAAFKTISEKGMMNIAKAFREEYNNMDEYERINIRRTCVYAGVFLIMQVIAAAMSGWRDDDDSEDDFMAQFVSYVGLRTVNELASQMPILLGLNVVDIINDPFVMARKLGDLTNFQNYTLNSVTSGAYQGETKLWRLLAKMTFIKQWYNIKTPEDIKRSSEWWLQTNQKSMMFFFGVGRSESEEEE